MTKGGPHTGKERKGKERKGKERKGKERKGKERKGKERKGKERKGKERGGCTRCRRLQHNADGGYSTPGGSCGISLHAPVSPSNFQPWYAH